MNTLRDGLPALPQRLTNLPIDARGYPVPRFVARLPNGAPDHRLADPKYLARAVQGRLCWVCAEKLERDLTHVFLVGPTALITNIAPEPPMHEECADYAVRACPHLAHPEAKRRGAGLPEETTAPPGVMLMDNPQVIGMWYCRTWGLDLHHGKPGRDLRPLFILPPPMLLRWMHCGRQATAKEAGLALHGSLARLSARAGVEDPQTLVALRKEAQAVLQAHRAVLQPFPVLPVGTA